MKEYHKPSRLELLLFKLRIFRYNCKLLQSGPERTLYIIMLLLALGFFLMYILHIDLLK